MQAQSRRVATAKPRRRWFQFRLSTLLVLVLACAIGLALFIAPAERQRRAVAFVEEQGGVVLYADEGGKATLAPEWLRQWLGKDYFQDAWWVSLIDTQVGDAGLAHLQGLTTLEWLTLSDTQVSDAGLAHLEGLTALHWLDLTGTQVSDAGLVHLQKLVTLTELDLFDSQVSDAGIAELRAALPNCTIAH